jgi:predicted MFS family arabinose efflux permease
MLFAIWACICSCSNSSFLLRLYGLTGGGFFSLFPAVTAEFVPVQKLQQGVSLAFFSMLFGGVFGTPISGLLADRVGFTAAIEFSGATTVTSAFILLYLRQRRSHGKIFCKV